MSTDNASSLGWESTPATKKAKTGTGRTTRSSGINLPFDIDAKLTEKAAKERSSRARIVTLALEEYFNKHGV